MRVRILILVALIVLILTGIGLGAHKKLPRASNPPAEPSIEQKIASLSDTMQAHFGGANKTWPGYTQTGVRVPPHGTGQAEQKVSFSTDGTLIRYEEGEAAVYLQVFVYDGHTLVERVIQGGGEVEPRMVEGAETAPVKFQMATFGVLPLLKRLAAPEAKVTLIDTTPDGDQFQVDTAAGSWCVFTDHEHLIERVKVGDVTIEFQDYRNVQGLTLPFTQTVTQGTQLKYRINFDAVKIAPPFPPDFFTRRKR